MFLSVSEETCSAKCGNGLPLGSSKNVFEELRDDKTWSTKCGSKTNYLCFKGCSPKKNIPHEEVFIGCTIIGIFFDSWIAEARQANRHEKLSERSEFFE